MNFESIITDVRILLDTDDAENGTHHEVTVALKLLGKPYRFTEWYDLETLELEIADSQRSTDNSDGYGALYNAIEDLEDDFCSSSIWDEIDEAVNRLIKIETNTNRFEDGLKNAGINQATFCELVDITRQAVAKWKKTGIFPSWVHYALLGIKEQERIDRTIEIDGFEAEYYKGALLVDVDGESIDIYKREDNKALLIICESGCYSTANKSAPVNLVLDSIESCEDFIAQVADGRPYDDASVFIDLRDELTCTN
jgi:hypothetical protein